MPVDQQHVRSHWGGRMPHAATGWERIAKEWQNSSKQCWTRKEQRMGEAPASHHEAPAGLVAALRQASPLIQRRCNRPHCSLCPSQTGSMPEHPNVQAPPPPVYPTIGIQPSSIPQPESPDNPALLLRCQCPAMALRICGRTGAENQFR